MRIGTYIVIAGITDEDADLNGKTGVVVPKHTFDSAKPHMVFGEIGVVLDDPDFKPRRINVLRNEVRPL